MDNKTKKILIKTRMFAIGLYAFIRNGNLVDESK